MTEQQNTAQKAAGVVTSVPAQTIQALATEGKNILDGFTSATKGLLSQADADADAGLQGAADQLSKLTKIFQDLLHISGGTK